MRNLTLNELIVLGNEVKYSLNTAVAVEGDYTDLQYRKRAFRKLGAWMFQVKCSEESGVITTSEAIETLFTPMMLANKKTIVEFRESGVIPVALATPATSVVVDQSALVAELQAQIAKLQTDNAKLVSAVKTGVKSKAVQTIIASV